MGRRFKIIMQYDGSNYCGWQRQRYQPSVQAKIENALQPLNQNQPVTVIAAGRTDSGVHARRQTAHFDLVTDLSPETIRKALNATLPDDIYIDYCQEVGKEFHARFTAINRTYHYQVVVKPDVFLRKYVWLVNFRFDRKLLQECAELVKGEHNFTALCRAATETENKMATIYESRWEEQDELLVYIITANRFLYAMVRMLVGSMMEVARGKYSIGAFKNLLGKNDTKMQVYTAPAQGLFLWNVKYQEDN